MSFNKFTAISAGAVVALAMISGCVPYHKVGKTEFPQGKTQKIDPAVACYNLRSVKIYDQFKTLAGFDALWLSEKTRSVYVDLYSSRRGKDAESREALLKRQLEENKLWHEFYVLADVRDSFNPMMSEKNANWTIFLQSDSGQPVAPILVKEVQLEPEIQVLFGCNFNWFKTAYLIKFPSKDLSGKPYLKSNGNFKMVFSTVDKRGEVEWNNSPKEDKFEIKKAEKRAKNDENIDWF
jgi:hypothetical protein